jgi:hypothetical protein
MLPKVNNQISSQKQTAAKAEILRQLLRREAEIGGSLFGRLSNGRHRLFFCQDEHSWIWHEEWLDLSGQKQRLITRYDISPRGVVKIQDGQHNQPISRSEAINLRDAIRLYRQRVMNEIYNRTT